MKTLVGVFTGVFICITAFSQTKVVHGELTAYNTYPVKNIVVKAKKAKSSVITDSLGRFSIVCQEKDVIQIKPKTFKAVKRKIGVDTDSLLINLVFVDSKKNREMAVGYGYINEKDLAYAVSQLEQENNEYCHYHDIFDLLSGRFAGVTVENGAIYIRGKTSINSSNEALYVVDGVISGSIAHIVPCDVKSISFIKDGMAAMYGSRGSNGVVVIETKRGGD